MVCVVSFQFVDFVGHEIFSYVIVITEIIIYQLYHYIST